MDLKRLYLIPVVLGVFFLVSFERPPVDDLPQKDFIVVLDAGHGGHDPGNMGNGYLEKNIALNIVLNVGKQLAQIPGVKVIYTRKDDTFVDLYVRGKIANEADADLFVSVHCDSHSSDAHGAGTFVLGLHANKQNFEIAKKENSAIYLEDDYETRYAGYDINSPESVIGLTIMQEEFLDRSIALAKFIQDNFTSQLSRVDRKVKQAGFIVLHQTFMPSVLIETGFLTNKTEGAYLNSGRGQTEMASAIATAILNYRNSISDNASSQGGPVGDTSPPKTEVAVEIPTTVEKTPDAVPTGSVPKQSPPVMEKKPETVVSKEEKVVEEIPEAATVKKEAPKTVVPGPKIVFKVQLFASSKDMSLDSNNFKGLNRISKEPVNKLFRYMYGDATTYFDAKLLKANADAKGYTDSYVVAYKDGERIPVPEALKYVSE
ncbi:MAG: N-acetylmuramoyl-L-alanine amidase [Sediminicola sp.]